MLQNFANYLLGSITNQGPATADEAVVENNSNNLRLTSIESDDEWILVDRHQNNSTSSDTNSFSDIDSVDDSLDVDVEEQGDLPALPTLLIRTNSTSSLPRPSTMEESWFLTPPPCFTSQGPIYMEESPLENLLIEHPSMSVYSHHTRRCNFAVPLRTPSPSEDGDDVVEAAVEEAIVIEDADNDDRELVVVVHRLPRISRVQVIQQQERQGLKGKQAQKVQIKKACQVMKRGCMDRNNKAREVNSSRNRRQRRGERSQGATRSHANNNRKC